MPYHNARLDRTRRELFGIQDSIDLEDWIEIPDEVDETIWKCRVNYGASIDQIIFEKYKERSISNFQLIDVDPDFDYRHKGDRTLLSTFYDLRDSADDVIMVRNGFLTDSYWSNIILCQQGRWFTPSTPLLRGTMRLHLLNLGMVTERIIRPSDIPKYDLVMPINALNPFDMLKAIPTSQIKL